MDFFNINTDDVKKSSVYRLDARSKLFIVLVYSVCLFFDRTWIALALSALFFFVVLFASKISPIKVFKLSTIVYVLALITLIFNSFLFIDGRMEFTLDGFLRGSFFGIRIILLVWMSLILCFTTTTEEINDAISSILSPLRRFRVPVDDIAMTLSIAIRFIPQTAEEFFSIKDAQWSRGGSFNEGNLFKRIKAHMSIMLPMIINLFRRSDVLAVSMDSRCYGIMPVYRGRLKCLKVSNSEKISMLFICIVLICIAAFL